VNKRFYTPHEAAEILQVSSSTVMNLIHDGKLPATRVSDRIYRISVPALERFAAGVPATAFEVTFRRVHQIAPIGEAVRVPSELELVEG